MTGGVTLKATVHPIERVGDHVVLTIDYALSGDLPPNRYLDIARFNDTWVQPRQKTVVRLVDLPGGRVWEAGRIGDSQSATTQGSLILNRKGQTVTTVTFFGPVDVDTVDVMLPKLGLVRDVPVVDDGATPSASGQTYEYDPPMALESLVRAYDGGASARKQGDAQTVVMASDVLFASDVADLSPEAAARVDAVAAQIAQATSGGEVHVVGHTDDVASAEYNMDLSLRRATSVADRLTGALGSSFTVTKEGKGKTEPAVQGTDDAARAANRRVEIEFTAAKAVDLPGASPDMPDATGPVNSGHDPVTYTFKGVEGLDVSYTVAVRSVVRRDGYLIGTFVAKFDSGWTVNNEYFLSEQRPSSGQNESLGYGNAANVTLMGPHGRVFPARYKRSSNPPIQVLTDLTVQENPLAGPDDSVTYTVVWPDTGEDSVTVDSPNRFRVTDVPVEEG